MQINGLLWLPPRAPRVVASMGEPILGEVKPSQGRIRVTLSGKTTAQDARSGVVNRRRIGAIPSSA